MHARTIVAALVAVATPLVGSRAQGTTATLSGRVTDSTGIALARVAVFVDRGGPRARTDPNGRFRLAGIVPGERLVVVRHPGYRSATLKLTLHRGEVRDTTVRLARLPVPLDTTVTEAEAASENLRRNGFYQRQRLGFGYFLDRDSIAHLRAYDVTDLLRRLPFVQVVERRPGRPIVTLQGGACRPVIYLDGMATPYFDDIPVELIDGVELYRRPVDVPLEFTRGRSPCAAVVIWTS